MFKYNKEHNKNIILHQITFDSSLSISEAVPSFKNNKGIRSLSLDKKGNLAWQNFISDVSFGAQGLTFIDKLVDNTLYIKNISSGNNISIKQDKNKGLIIDCLLNFIEDGKIKDTEIYYKNDRIGIGRNPLYNYKLDISVPKNKLMTAIHVGDGSYGFSFGCGTDEGFLPELIGFGSDANDAGLYFLGVTEDDASSGIPLIIIDGRMKNGNRLQNRPILGITNSNYYNYEVLIDNNGNIYANDLLINNISLNERIKILEEELQKLKKFLNI